jgi:hypothetical protein
MTNKEKFIEKAVIKHDYKYDYSLVIYENSRKKIKIICKDHGIFEQEPSNHLRGQGCPICAGVKNYTQLEFIEKANKIHNSLYDYSLVQYKNNKTNIKIICKKHGIFESRPDRHLNSKSGCPKCANNILYTKEEFIEKANKVHNNKYNYSEVNYETALTKIKIICPDHGTFEQRPTNHLRGEGCIKCSGCHQYTNKEFIQKANIIHNNIYDYLLTNYTNSQEKIKIICKKHGEFEQMANSHLQGFGCSKCYNEKRTYNTEKFIELSKLKHGNFYDYSLVEYIHSRKKVNIICPIHGEFEQQGDSHLKGSGCPICNASKGEKEIRLFLERNNIIFNTQHTFENCKNERYLPFDFYIPIINTCIEFDGLQHFKPIEYFGGEKTLKITKAHDKIKTDFCINNSIKLIRIMYNENILDKLNYHLHF